MGQLPDKTDFGSLTTSNGLPAGVRQATPVGQSSTPWIQPKSHPVPAQSQPHHFPQPQPSQTCNLPTALFPSVMPNVAHVLPVPTPMAAREDVSITTTIPPAVTPHTSGVPSQGLLSSTQPPNVNDSSATQSLMPSTFQLKRFRSSPTDKSNVVKRYRSC